MAMINNIFQFCAQLKIEQKFYKPRLTIKEINIVTRKLAVMVSRIWSMRMMAELSLKL